MVRNTHHVGAGSCPRSRARRWISASAIAGVAILPLALVAPSVGASPTTTPGVAADTAVVAQSSAPPWATGAGRTAAHPHDAPNCTFNGQTEIVPDVSPGSSVTISCTGWPAFDSIDGAEFSPLEVANDNGDAIDQNLQMFTSDGAGNLSATFVIPNPFSAPDPAAVCPPTPTQRAEIGPCGIVLADDGDNGAVVAVEYGATPPPPTAVGVAPTPSGNGYWIAWSNGNVTDHGGAGNYGNASGLALTQPITHIVSTPDGKGYWLVAADGGTFAYGDAGFYGSTGGMTLNAPVVDMAPTPDGRGYWLVASDGGIFAFGDAAFQGSMGGVALNKPVVGIAGDTHGGYWLVASDGGIFSFGGAQFLGSTGGMPLNLPVNGMAATSNGQGYWFVASDGGIFSYGNAVFHGSTGGMALAAPVVGMAADNATGGYWLVGGDGGIFAFGAPFFGSH